MTWTAPMIEVANLSRMPDERTMLEESLEQQRETLLMKCSGLTGEQLALRTIEPSSMSLLGLLRHLAEAERWWFRTHLLGLEVPDLYVTDESEDGDFDDLDPSRAEEDYATYLAETALCREAVAGLPLDFVFLSPRHRVDTSLRWLLQHMVIEYARHNGHADLLRERIDGSTGL
jgi:uncharacterized damage-inducible protein DinB